MMYFLYGTDVEAGRKKAHELIDSLQKKKPDASFFKVTSETWSKEVIDELSGGQGLFEKKYIVHIDRVLDGLGQVDRETIRDELVEKAELMAESENVFILLEGKLDKVTATKLEKCAEKTQVFDLGVLASKKPVEDGPSTFALGDALGRRDKKAVWVLYRECIDAGKSPEEIHGTLFWQVKSIALAMRTKTAGEAGLAPFVYSKSKGFSEYFSKEEIDQLLDGLVAIAHDARRGKHELETALEAFLLAM